MKEMKTIISKSFPILTSQTRIMDRYQPWGMHKYIPYGTSRQSGIYRGKTGHRTTLSFRTSAHTGVGISIKFRATYRHTDRSFIPFSGIWLCVIERLYFYPGDCHARKANWLAMTGNSVNSQFVVLLSQPDKRKKFRQGKHSACAFPAGLFS